MLNLCELVKSTDFVLRFPCFLENASQSQFFLFEGVEM